MHVLFDLDGTLTDPKEGFVKCVRYALAELGIELDAATSLESCIGPPLHDTFRKLCKTDRIAEQAISLYRARYAKTGLFENKPYDGIHACLSQILASADSIHVVTSKPTVFSTRIIEHFKMERYFGEVFGSNLDGTLSDKTELLGHVLERRGLLPGETIMIGDRRYDIVGAKNHGVKALGVLWGYGSEAELTSAGADGLCAHPAEIHGHIFN